MPILARVFQPGELGTYALYLSFVTILSLPAGARYDAAVIQCKHDALARVTVLLSTSVAAAFSLATLLLVLGLQTAGGSERLGIGTYHWLALVPAGAFLSVVSTALSNYLLRSFRATPVAVSRLLLSATSAIIAITAGLYGIGHIALVAASLAGLFLSTTYLVSVVGIWNRWRRPSRHRVLAAARKYSKYPKWDLPSSLTGVISTQLPTLLLGSLFGTTFLGNYSLVERLFLAPLNVLGSSIGSIFRVKATQSFHSSGHFYEEFKSTFLLLGFLGVAIFFPLFSFGERAIVLIFGQDWRTAGRIAEVIAPLYLVRLVASPLSTSFYVRSKMSLDACGQALIAVCTITSLLIGNLANDAWLALRLFSASNACVYFLYIAASWRLARPRTPNTTKPYSL